MVRSISSEPILEFQCIHNKFDYSITCMACIFLFLDDKGIMRKVGHFLFRLITSYGIKLSARKMNKSLQVPYVLYNNNIMFENVCL